MLLRLPVWKNVHRGKFKITIINILYIALTPLLFCQFNSFLSHLTVLLCLQYFFFPSIEKAIKAIGLPFTRPQRQRIQVSCCLSSWGVSKALYCDVFLCYHILDNFLIVIFNKSLNLRIFNVC